MTFLYYLNNFPTVASHPSTKKQFYWWRRHIKSILFSKYTILNLYCLSTFKLMFKQFWALWKYQVMAIKYDFTRSPQMKADIHRGFTVGLLTSILLLCIFFCIPFFPLRFENWMLSTLHRRYLVPLRLVAIKMLQMNRVA